MLLKWIRCAVGDPARFDRGQTAWAGLHGFPGFLGQRGGWDLRHPRVAHIFGQWADPASYQAFMSGPHDVLAARQTGTFDAIEVRLYDVLQAVGHSLERVTGQQMLQVVRRPVPHVTDIEVSVRAPGFQGGLLAQREAHEFVVLTQWETARAYPKLVERADQIGLEATWYVPPTT